jgi:carbonic anhydrase/acetyltransferase-like protein (isoleucine patch superfamily)
LTLGIASGAFVAPGARLTGDVRMAADSSVFPGSELRGEAAYIEIGSNANVQDNCVVEGTSGHPVIIGARVSIGHNATVRGATVEPGALVAIGATVLEGAHIGTHAIVAANATVPAGMRVPERKLVIGAGRIMRDVTDVEVERIEYGAREYTRLARDYLAT